MGEKLNGYRYPGDVVQEALTKLIEIKKLYSIKREVERKRAISNQLKTICEKWIAGSAERIGAASFIIGFFLNPQNISFCKSCNPLEIMQYRLGEKRIDLCAIKDIPSKELLCEFQNKLGAHIHQSCMSPRLIMSILNYIVSFPFVVCDVLDVLFKADTESSNKRLSLHRMLLQLYCDNVLDREAQNKIMFAALYMMVEDESRYYRNRNEWWQALIKKCATSKDDADTLYELYYILAPSYELIPIPSSAFTADHLRANSEAIANHVNGKEKALRFFWSIPDEYCAGILNMVLERFAHIAEVNEATKILLEDNRDAVLQNIAEMWKELNDPDKCCYALRSGGIDRVDMRLPVITDGCKIQRITLVGDNIPLPGAELRFDCKRGPCHYSYTASIIDDGNEVPRLDMPINGNEPWFKDLLLAMTVDILHAVTVKHKTRFQQKKKAKRKGAGSEEKGSMAEYIKSTRTLGAHTRKLLPGQKARMDEDRWKLYRKKFGDIPLDEDLRTFVREVDQTLTHKKTKGFGSDTKEYLFLYKENNLLRLVGIETNTQYSEEKGEAPCANSSD